MTKIGITGHQNIGTDQVLDWVRTEIENSIRLANCTHGYTCLAVGADQLFAEVLKANSISFTVIIPCFQYDQTFLSDATVRHYKELRADSSSTILLDFIEPSAKAFYAAGKRVADEADLLIAVWDGKPAKGLGGTADVVHYAQKNGKPIVHINTLDLYVTKYQ